MRIILDKSYHEKFIADYDPKVAPAILVPKSWTYNQRDQKE